MFSHLLTPNYGQAVIGCFNGSLPDRLGCEMLDKSFPSGSSPGLDACRIENYLFTAAVQVCEQVAEHKKIGFNKGLS
jgi:hypothetical protein